MHKKIKLLSLLMCLCVFLMEFGTVKVEAQEAAVIPEGLSEMATEVYLDTINNLEPGQTLAEIYSEIGEDQKEVVYVRISEDVPSTRATAVYYPKQTFKLVTAYGTVSFGVIFAWDGTYYYSSSSTYGFTKNASHPNASMLSVGWYNAGKQKTVTYIQRTFQISEGGKVKTTLNFRLTMNKGKITGGEV